jgi:hypothetical protein
MKCDASWEDALRGRVPVADMTRVLDLPRLLVLDRRRATIRNLERAVDAARAMWPGEPILVAIDYAQLLESREREERQRVAHAFAQIDDCAARSGSSRSRSRRCRVSARTARKGEALGADSADLGAETAAIERFATVTLSIGMAAEREDGSSAVELSIGKWRMGKGDRVVPMTTRAARASGVSPAIRRPRARSREQRDADQADEGRSPLSSPSLAAAHQGQGSGHAQTSSTASVVAGSRPKWPCGRNALIARGISIEVNQRQLRSKYWLVWTPDRARDVGDRASPDHLCRRGLMQSSPRCSHGVPKFGTP